MKYVAVTALTVFAAGALHAQEPITNLVVQARTIETKILAEHAAVESRITRGAPYAAEVVTESVQPLADGNRIVTKNLARVFRDSEGRTRREQLAPNGVDVATVNISDPVAEAMYFLDPARRTAFHNGVIIATATGVASATLSAGSSGTIVATRMPDGAVSVSANDGIRKEGERGVTVAGHERIRKELHVQAHDAAGVPATGGGISHTVGVAATGAAPMGVFARVAEGQGQSTREELGQQMIEGVMAKGSRTTTEIAAGAIGNEQPIRIVSEQWFSPELQVLVLTRHSDPRMGETTYRLSGIVRGEQPRALFEVPSDYALKESTIRRRNQ